MQFLLELARQGSCRNWRPVVVFFGQALAISWAFWVPTIVAGDNPFRVPGYYGGGLGPLIAALIATRLFGSSPLALVRRLWRWRVVPEFWLFAIGFPTVLAFGASAVRGVLAGQVTLVGPGQRIALGLLAFLGVNEIGCGNEEPGWKGFAQSGLQTFLMPSSAMLGLGLLWAL